MSDFSVNLQRLSEAAIEKNSIAVNALLMLLAREPGSEFMGHDISPSQRAEQSKEGSGVKMIEKTGNGGCTT